MIKAPPNCETPFPAPLVAAIGMALVCCVVFHGYEIFNFTLSIDEELKAYLYTPSADIQQGRWGRVLYYWLIAENTTDPVTPIAAGLTLYSVAFVLLIKNLLINNWRSVVVAAPIFFGFPVILYDVAFNFVALDLGLGSLSAVLALQAAQKRTPAGFVAASMLIAFATSLYQSLLYFSIIIFLADLVKLAWGARPTIEKTQQSFVWYGAIFGTALLIYASISISLLSYLDLGFAQRGYFRPNLIFQDSLIVFETMLSQIWKIYSGFAPSFLGEGVYYRLLMVVCLAVLFWSLFVTWRKSARVGLTVLALLGAILFAPFLQHPLNAGYLPYRALVGVPAALTVVVLFAAERSAPNLRKWLLLPLAALLMFEFSTINNRQYYAGHWQLERDAALGTQIIARIQETLPDEPAYTIAVVGFKPVKHDALVPFVNSSTLGQSFFSWDGGNSTRIAMFLNFLSDATFRAPSSEQMEAALRAAGVMPIWPLAGSVRRIGDVVAIKLSEPSPPQISVACTNRHSAFCAQHGY